MSTERVIAVDLGASSGRVAGVRTTDAGLEIDSVHRFSNAPVRRESGGSHRWCWDVDAIMKGVSEGIRAVASHGGVDSIAIDSWAVDYGLVDDRGELVAPVTAYRDERHAASSARLRAELGDAAIYGRTGIQFQSFNTLYQLAADAVDPDGPFDRARRMLMIPDLVAHRLCGSVTGERTNAGSTQCFDLERDAWIPELLEAAGVPMRLMPEVVAGETSDPIGVIGPAIADALGLPAGTPMRATATHDTAAAVAAAPLAGPGDVFISSGTWSLVGLELGESIRTPAAMRINATNEPGIFGTTRFLRNVAGLWLLQECRRAWAEDGRDLDWATLASMAEAAEPFRSLFDPDDPGLAAPGGMPGRIAAVIAAGGDPVPEDDGAMVRAILDSVSLRTAEAVRSLAEVAGRRLDRVVVVGGGAANGLLNRLISACSGLPVVVGSTESTSLGNAVVQIASSRGLRKRADLAGLLPVATPVADPDDLPEVRRRAVSAGVRLAALDAKT